VVPGAARRRHDAAGAPAGRRIREGGPITVADYMAECLLHPVHGYYTTRDPFGAAGDFTTAPEISQMFGELVGLALAQAWLDQGAPAPFTLAELGPGRGTLMADVLRATRGVPGFHAAAQVVLVEASPVLRAGAGARHAGARMTRPALDRRRMETLPEGAAVPDRQRILRRPADPPVHRGPNGLARTAGRPEGRRAGLWPGRAGECRSWARRRPARAEEGLVEDNLNRAGNGVIKAVAHRRTITAGWR
jgi:NADH dehydrogenase [ubiquinone] 1 alpha subcomplex assembly factor 7